MKQSLVEQLSLGNHCVSPMRKARQVPVFGGWIRCAALAAAASGAPIALAGAPEVTDLPLDQRVKRSLELPIEASALAAPTSTPEWMRAFLGDVEIEAAPTRADDVATTALKRLRQAWARGDHALVEAALKEIGNRSDGRADFVLLEAEIRRAWNDPLALRRCLEKPGWAGMRAAAAAYRFWLADDDPGARDRLGSAIVREAETEPESRIFVGALLESWGFPEIAAEIWILVAASDHPAREYARAHVTQLAMRTGRTPLLLRLCAALADKRPEDAAARFTHVYLGFLLGQDSGHLLDEARALHADQPDSPATAALLAFGFLREGDRDAATRALAQADLVALQERPQSLLGALVLEFADPARSRALAEASGKFLRLPEEMALYRAVIERLPKDQVQ